MLDLVQPTGELLLEVQKSFNEDVKSTPRDLEAIKEWLHKEPHLPNDWEDQAILTFLRGCNFSLEKCKKKLDMYFTMRSLVPEFYVNRDINRSELQQILSLCRLAVLPGLTPDGRRVTVGAARHIDFETPDIANFFKVVLMVGDLRLLAELVGVSGDIYVLDGSVVLLKHFMKVSPLIAKKFLTCVQEAYPVKLKEIHIINPTSLIDFLINWLSPFLKEKIRKRIFVHHSLESLHGKVPKENLPEEFGGTAGKIEEHMIKMQEVLSSYGGWFKEQEALKSDESKRVGEPKNFENLFGLDGSFRQLSID